MYMKTCNYCYEPSFSANQKGMWVCPVCYSDLTDLKAIYIKPGSLPPLLEKEKPLKVRD